MAVNLPPRGGRYYVGFYHLYKSSYNVFRGTF